MEAEHHHSYQPLHQSEQKYGQKQEYEPQHEQEKEQEPQPKSQRREEPQPQPQPEEGNGPENHQEHRKQTNRLIDQIYEFVIKSEAKILVNPVLLRTTIKIMVEKMFKVSLTKSTLKKIPVVGIITGVVFGIWRTVKGEYKRAGAEVASGLAGATGFGIGPSIAIDVGILGADILVELKQKKMIA